MRPGLTQDIIDLTLEHIVLVVSAMSIAIAIGVPAGILLTRRAAWRRPVLTIANVLQTIPSLALFGFLIPLPLLGGIGTRTAILALVLYALLPIVRNTLTGILGVDPAVRESAVAMGMTARQVLRAGGIAAGRAHHPGRNPHRHGDHDGHRHHRGRHRRRRPGSFHLSRRRLGRFRRDSGRSGSGGAHRPDFRRRIGMDRTKICCLTLVAALALTGCGTKQKPIVVGSKNFTEQVVLGEIIAQHLEHRLGPQSDPPLQHGRNVT